MSHLKERLETNCLNCNAEVNGKFCHICGQENIKPEESASHLIAHFFKDITHFDGKFFSTLKYLVLKPGFLSGEYKAGRRASYLNPIRMYVFTSAIFFLIFFSVSKVDDRIVTRTYGDKTLKQIEALDSLQFDEITRELNNGKPISRAAFAAFADSLDKNDGIHFTSGNYKTVGEYDSLLKSGKKKHNWFQKQLIYKEIAINKKYQNDQAQITKVFIDNLMHSFPQMLFVSLPLFAMMLKLLYFRHKEYYYASHIIFSTHLYIFVFIMLLVAIGLKQLMNLTDWNWLKFFIALDFFYIFGYLYKSMRNFYGQRRGKTILKYLLLNLLMLIVIVCLFLVFTFTSLLKI